MMAERWSGYKLSRGPSREVEGSNLDVGKNFSREVHHHFDEYKCTIIFYYAI